MATHMTRSETKETEAFMEQIKKHMIYTPSSSFGPQLQANSPTTLGTVRIAEGLMIMFKTVTGKILCWVRIDNLVYMFTGFPRRCSPLSWWQSVCMNPLQVVMKPSMKDPLSTEPSFFLARKGKGPIIPVWVKGYSSFIGHKEKAACGYGWWKGSGLGMTLGRVLVGMAGTQPVAYVIGQWNLAMWNEASKGKQRAVRGDWVCRVCVLVWRINQDTFPRGAGSEGQTRSRQSVGLPSNH